jgi:hypothetical protein
VLAWLDGGLSGLGSLCGGDEASKADGLGGEAGVGERVARLREWDGPGWGGFFFFFKKRMFNKWSAFQIRQSYKYYSGRTAAK